MPSTPLDFSNPQKLLVQIQPALQQQLKKEGPSLKQRSHVALRTFLAGAACSPRF